MDYEKKYKKALERAKKLHKDAITLQLEQDIKDYEYIFPELKESEDERIKKEIIVHIKWCEDNGYCAKEEMTRWINWLEKQGEQKPEENKGNVGGISSNWSEEDSFRTETLISVIKSGGSIRPELRNEFVNWLKSLKERIGG